MRKLSIALFIVSFIGIGIYYGIICYTVYSVTKNPNETAKEIGKIVKSFNEGVNDTTLTN